jgi:hypothetical protein
MTQHNLPYRAVIITAVTPVGTFVTPQIALDDENITIVESIIGDSGLRSRYRLPVSNDEVVILTPQVVLQTVFKVRYIA